MVTASPPPPDRFFLLFSIGARARARHEPSCRCTWYYVIKKGKNFYLKNKEETTPVTTSYWKERNVLLMIDSSFRCAWPSHTAIDLITDGDFFFSIFDTHTRNMHKLEYRYDQRSLCMRRRRRRWCASRIWSIDRSPGASSCGNLVSTSSLL